MQSKLLKSIVILGAILISGTNVLAGKTKTSCCLYNQGECAFDLITGNFRKCYNKGDEYTKGKVYDGTQNGCWKIVNTHKWDAENCSIKPACLSSSYKYGYGDCVLND